FATWIGVDAIATRSTWLWGSASHWSLSGLTATYRVRGSLAIVIGVGWLFDAVASLVGLASPENARHSRIGYAVTGFALLVFAICFIYVAAKSVLQVYFPTWA